MQQKITRKTIGTGRAKRPAGRSLYTNNGNDRVYTPPDLARDIVAHFKPSGRILEPAAGQGSFVQCMPGCDWCEIDYNIDFFDATGHYDWIVTNPPYSIFSEFLAHALRLADNIVFLCPENSWGTYKRSDLVAAAGFGFAEQCRVPRPLPPWPQFGMVVGATWVRRGWLGSPQSTRLPSKLWAADGRKMLLTQTTCDAGTVMNGACL